MIVVWLAYTISFFLLYVIPGDAALARLGGEGGAQAASPAQLAELRDRLGLSDPLPIQYLHRLGGVLTGDLGNSLRNDQSVRDIIAGAIPSTLGLAASALVLALVFGVGTAILSNLSRTRWLRSFLLTLPAVGMGVPNFWIGIILISVFSFWLRIMPASGNVGIQSLILPAVTLAIGPAATIAQVFGASLHDSLAQMYATTTSPAKGAGKARVLLVHCARNAAIPALTVAGLIVGNLLAGSVVVETVYSRSGVGRVMLDAVQAVDLTVVQGIVLLAALVFVAVNLLVDFAYPLVDPRLRRGQSRRAQKGASQ